MSVFSPWPRQWHETEDIIATRTSEDATMESFAMDQVTDIRCSLELLFHFWNPKVLRVSPPPLMQRHLPNSGHGKKNLVWHLKGFWMFMEGIGLVFRHHLRPKFFRNHTGEVFWFYQTTIIARSNQPRGTVPQRLIFGVKSEKSGYPRKWKLDLGKPSNTLVPQTWQIVFKLCEGEANIHFTIFSAP